MKLAIIGSRTFNNYDFLREKIFYHFEINKINTIISGGASGVDTLAQQFAKEYGKKLVIFYPNYHENKGKQAPLIRNLKIIEECNQLIAFWDGKSKGTKFTIDNTKKQNKRVIIEYVN